MKFFKVNPEFFELEKSYSFRIFLYDSERETRLNSLIERTDLTQEKLDEWTSYIEKGAYLQIHNADVDDFYLQTNTPIEKFEAQNSTYFKCQEIYKKRLDEFQSIVEEDFAIKDCILEASKTNNFLPLINRVKAEILCFELTFSQDTSTCTQLVEKLLQKDISLTRVAALAYMIAKANKIDRPQTLADLVFSVLYRDVGHNMINRSLFENKETLMDSSFYMKHPMLSIYILSKTGYDFNKHIKRYILEHHEQSDGSGYPRQKKESQTDLLSHIINMSEQLVNFCMDHETAEEPGSKGRLIQGLWIMRKKTEHPAFNTSFPDDLCSSLLKLIKLEES